MECLKKMLGFVPYFALVKLKKKSLQGMTMWETDKAVIDREDSKLQRMD